MIEKLVAGVVTPLFGAMMAFGLSDIHAQDVAQEPERATAGTATGTARAGTSTRPKVLDAQPNARTTVGPPVEPVVAPVEEGANERVVNGVYYPKERDKEATGRVAGGTPIIVPDAPPVEADAADRTGRPKERDDSVRTHTRRTAGRPVVTGAVTPAPAPATPPR